MMTVAPRSGYGVAHAWQVGTVEALCGATVEDMHATGRPWPPVEGEVCRVCVRAHRMLVTSSMWATFDAWLTPRATSAQDAHHIAGSHPAAHRA